MSVVITTSMLLLQRKQSILSMTPQQSRTGVIDHLMIWGVLKQAVYLLIL